MRWKAGRAGCVGLCRCWACRVAHGQFSLQPTTWLFPTVGVTIPTVDNTTCTGKCTIMEVDLFFLFFGK